MKTTLAERPSSQLAKRPPSHRDIIRVNDLRVRLIRWGKEFMDNYAPLKSNIGDGRQLMLNTELWDAFKVGDRNRILRLVKAGADPHSLERKVQREELKIQY
ncbi:MAG: hypothetical protein GY852_11945 [bacterium]|nr:hypothetical protein [bacterium]